MQQAPTIGENALVRDRTCFVCMLASRKYGTLHIGVTNDPLHCVAEHRDSKGGQFTTNYTAFLLVWYEVHRDIEVAIQRETSLERRKRDWKSKLIERENPLWIDLNPSLTV